MSYCRVGSESDVYLFYHQDGYFCCYGCVLKGWRRPIVDLGDKVQDAIDHLEIHAKAGHRVPERALERLREELKVPAHLR